MQPLDIPVWKWEDITMEFITKLPRTARGVDSILVIMDRLTKSAHFILIAKRISTEKLVDIYVREVVVMHKVPLSMVSECNVCFTSRFFRKFHMELGTQFHFSTTYSPHTDGQSEQMI